MNNATYHLYHYVPNYTIFCYYSFIVVNFVGYQLEDFSSLIPQGKHTKRKYFANNWDHYE